MAENYKMLYEQMKKIVTTYHDEVVPGLREIIKDLEQNQIKVRCKDCKNRCDEGSCPMYYVEEIEWDDDGYTEVDFVPHDLTHDEGFCDRGERRNNEPEKPV